MKEKGDMGALSATAALVIIDVQKAMDDPRWGTGRNNPALEANLQKLLAVWRRTSRPIYHVQHASTEPHSTYRPDGPGYPFKPEVAPLPGEGVIVKRTNSAFIGTGFEQRLRDAGHTTLVVGGVITNNSVEATVRMAGNLGFDTYLVADACATVGRTDYNGKVWSADDVHALSLANMDREYATLATTAEILARLDQG
jgi:nicotinamidase-related amidase